MAVLLLLLLTLVFAHGAQQLPQQMSFAERLAARNTSALLGATPRNNACGGSNTWNLGSMDDSVFVVAGCANSAVRASALYDAQNAQYALTPYKTWGLLYDYYTVYVVPTCATDAASLEAAGTPLNGKFGDSITSPFTSPTYTCASQECCLYIFCENTPGFPCSRGSLKSNFTLRTNAGVVAGIVISALAVVVIVVVCVMRARRKAAAGSNYNDLPAAPSMVVYNAAAPSAPPQAYQQPYQQPAFMQPQQYQQPQQQYQQYQQPQYQQQEYQQPPPQYQQQQFQQPPPQQWR